MTNFDLLKKDFVEYVEKLTPEKMARLIIDKLPEEKHCLFCLDYPPDCPKFSLCSEGIVHFLESEAIHD